MPIHYEKRDRIVTITIDRPERRNALDLEHFGQLADAWVRFRDDDDAHVAILTGVGDVYCVGADLKSFIPIVTERADKLSAGESKLPQEGSRTPWRTRWSPSCATGPRSPTAASSRSTSR